MLWGAAGAAVSLLLNYLQVTPGVSTDGGGQGQQTWGIFWNGVDRELDMTTAYSYTQDVDYEGYSQNFSLVTANGDPVTDNGQIEYYTNYYYSNPNLMQVGYDDSGVISIGYSAPS